MKTLKTYSYLILLLVIMRLTTSAQDVGAPTLMSQPRTTTANIGNCDITIKYHSPSVNGRKIFGGIVPFDFVVDGKEYPWRAGSNQRTTIEFSHDVVIDGQALKAGSYGFLVLVSEKEWTLIFSEGKSWGAFNYDPVKDILRMPVRVQSAPFQEWLSYEFENPRAESVDVVLHWENTAISFKISTDAKGNIIKDILAKEEKEIRDYQKLASFTLIKEPKNLDKALEYLKTAQKKIPSEKDEVMRRVHTFSTKVSIGEILLQKGENKKGQQLIDEALEISDGFDVYYYALRKYTVEGKKKEAFKILKRQSERRPKAFQTYIAFGEYYLKEKDQVKAVEHFKKAYELAVEQESRWINYTRYLYLQNKLVLENM